MNDFLQLLLVLLAAFYLVLLPILLFVSLGGRSGLQQRLRQVEIELADLRIKLNRLTPTKVEVSKAEPQKPAAVTPSAPLSHSAAVPPPLTGEIPMPIPPIEPISPAPAMARNSTPPVVKSPASTSTVIESPKDPGAEITLGARWATRLGIGFLVIAVVFFGVYITKFSTPPIRLLEVVAVAAGVTGLGLWLERQAREFGEAVFAGGLALFYFAAFAAHVIPAMQVIPDAQVGLGLTIQYLAAGLIAGIAWRRNRPHMAAMAIALGMVSCFFALHRDQMEISLGAALGLAAIAAALRAARGWIWPAVVGYVGAQFCYIGSVLVTMGFTVENFFSHGILYSANYRTNPVLVMWPGFTLVFPAAYFLLLTGADIWAQLRGRKDSAMARTGAVLVAAVLYGLGGWWGGAVMGHSWASYNLLVAAVICLAIGLVYHRRRDVPEIYEILYAAARVWTAIYFINEYTNWIRWLALLLESFIFAWRARRHGSACAWVCLLGAWACSGVMAFIEAAGLANGLPDWDPARLKIALWPVVSAALWSWLERSPQRPAQNHERGLLDLGGYLMAGATAVLGVTAWVAPAQSWMFMALGIAFVIIGLSLKTTRITAPTAVLALLFSMWLYAPFPHATVREILPTLAAFTVVVLAATGLLQYRASSTRIKNLALGAEVLGFLSLLFVWFQGLIAMELGTECIPLALTLAALALAALAWRGPWRATADIAWAWALVALITGLYLRDSLPNEANRLCLATVLTLGWLTGLLYRRENPGVFVMRPHFAGLIIPGILFAGWTALALPNHHSLEYRAPALAGFAVFYALAGSRSLQGGGAAAVLLSIGAAGSVFGLKMPDAQSTLIPAAVSLAILFQGWLMAQRFRKWNRALRDVFLILVALAALVVFDWSAAQIADASYRYLTLFWAGAGAVLFLAGLAARLRAYRYTGLAGLALCVPRVFFIDITDQFGRILAFGGLALVLLAIGFSYHKLRSWLVALDGEEVPTPKNSQP